MDRVELGVAGERGSLSFRDGRWMLSWYSGGVSLFLHLTQDEVDQISAAIEQLKQTAIEKFKQAGASG